MAENFFGIQDDATDIEQVNDMLFSDVKPEELEDVKKKEAEELKKKTDAEALRLAEEAKKKPPKEEKTGDEIDPTEALFGGAEENVDEEGNPKPGFKKDEDGKIVADPDYKAEEEDEDDENADDSQFEILSKELYKIGVFSPEYDEETGEEIVHTAKTPEEFKKLFEYQKQVSMYSMLDNHLSKFGADRLELFDAIFTKGVEPKEYLPIYNEIEDLEAMSLDAEINQEKIVREAYKRSGLAEDKIEGKIKRLKDIAELQAEAEDLKDMLIEQNKKSLKQQEDEKVALQKAEELRDSQYKASITKILTEKTTAKEFDGIPVNPQVAQKAYDFLYNKKWQDANGKKFTDFDKFVLELKKPENHQMLVKAGLLFQNNLDLTKVQKKAVSNESSELFKDLATKKTKQAKKATPAPWNL